MKYNSGLGNVFPFGLVFYTAFVNRYLSQSYPISVGGIFHIKDLQGLVRVCHGVRVLFHVIAP